MVRREAARQHCRMLHFMNDDDVDVDVQFRRLGCDLIVAKRVRKKSG